MKNKIHESRLRRPDLNLHRILETPESRLEIQAPKIQVDGLSPYLS